MAKTLADCLHIADKALKGPQGIPAWWEYDKGRIREAEKAGRTPALAVQELLDEVLAEREAVVSQLPIGEAAKEEKAAPAPAQEAEKGKEAKHEALIGSVVGAPGNLTIRVRGGRVIEQRREDGPVHALVAEYAKVPLDDVVDTGLIDSKGVYFWRGSARGSVKQEVLDQKTAIRKQKAKERIRQAKPIGSIEKEGYSIVEVKKGSQWTINVKDEMLKADIQAIIRDLEEGRPGKRVRLDLTEGTGPTKYGFAPERSTYPAWFQNQGWTAKDGIKALQNVIDGVGLGKKQVLIAETAFDAYLLDRANYLNGHDAHDDAVEQAINTELEKRHGTSDIAELERKGIDTAESRNDAKALSSEAVQDEENLSDAEKEARLRQAEKEAPWLFGLPEEVRPQTETEKLQEKIRDLQKEAYDETAKFAEPWTDRFNKLYAMAIQKRQKQIAAYEDQIANIGKGEKPVLTMEGVEKEPESMDLFGKKPEPELSLSPEQQAARQTINKELNNLIRDAQRVGIKLPIKALSQAKSLKEVLGLLGEIDVAVLDAPNKSRKVMSNELFRTLPRLLETQNPAARIDLADAIKTKADAISEQLYEAGVKPEHVTLFNYNLPNLVDAIVNRVGEPSLSISTDDQVKRQPHRESVLEAVEAVKKRLPGGPQVEAMFWDEVPQAIRTKVKRFFQRRGEDFRMPKGIFLLVDGKPFSYLVLDKIDDAQDGAETVLHESLGHFGPKVVLPPKQYRDFFTRAYWAHSKEINANVKAKKYPFDLTTHKGRMKAAEEWFAAMAQDEASWDQPKWLQLWNRFVRMIRQALRRLGYDPVMRKLGLPSLKLSDTEIKSVMQQAFRALQNPDAVMLTMPGGQNFLFAGEKSGIAQGPLAEAKRMEGGAAASIPLTTTSKRSILRKEILNEQVSEKASSGWTNLLPSRRREWDRLLEDYRQKSERDAGRGMEGAFQKSWARIRVSDRELDSAIFETAWNHFADRGITLIPVEGTVDFGATIVPGENIVLVSTEREKWGTIPELTLHESFHDDFVNDNPEAVKLVNSVDTESKDFKNYVERLGAEAPQWLKETTGNIVSELGYDPHNLTEEQAQEVLDTLHFTISEEMAADYVAGKLPDTIFRKDAKPNELIKNWVKISRRYSVIPLIKDTITDIVKGGIVDRRKHWITTKPDTALWERILKTLDHYADKVPALKRMLEHALHKRENYQKHMDDIILPDQRKDSHIASLMKFQKEDPVGFARFKNYLWELDMNNIRYTVTEDEETGKFTLTDPKGTNIGTFGTEKEAWVKARDLEAQTMRDKKFSDQTINAVMSVRAMTDAGFDKLVADLRAIVAEREAAGMELPEVKYYDEDGKLKKVSLKTAMKMMGDLRGSYMPRSRRRGRFSLMAKKEGENPHYEFFDYKWTLGKEARKWQRKGYTVEKNVAGSLSEDVLAEARLTTATQSVLQKAFQHMEKELDLPTSLKDLGITGEWGKTKDGKDEYIIEAPFNAEHIKAFKTLGGHWYAKEKGDKEKWRFSEPPDDIADKLLAEIAKTQTVTPDMVEMYEAVLIQEVSDIFKARGFRQHMVPRKKVTGKDVVLGFEEDPIRALTKYAQGIAGGMSKKQMAMQMIHAMVGTPFDEDGNYLTYAQWKEDGGTWATWREEVKKNRIDPGQQKNAYGEAKALMEDLLRNEEFSDRVIGTLRGIATLKYLGFRPAAALVNITNMVAAVPATMAGIGKIPILRTFKLITQASTLYVRYLRNPDSVQQWQRDLFDEIRHNGWHTPQFNREAIAALQSRAGRGWSRLMEWSMFMFGKSEELNRVATIAGTYMGLKQKPGFDHVAAMKLAKEVSDKAHGVYEKATLPYFARGSNPAAQAIRTFYTFKRFSHNYIQTMLSLGFTHKDKKAMLYMWAAPAILAGPGALAGAEIINAALRRILDSDDPEEDLYNFLHQEFGQEVSNLARFGAIGAGGYGPSIKGSLAIGITDIPMNIKDLLGAPASVITDLYQGGQSVLKGNVMKGFEKMAPNFMAAPMQAYRERTEGLTTFTNAPIFRGAERVYATDTDAIMRMLTFNPARIAGIKEARYKEGQVEQAYREKGYEIYGKIKRFLLLPEEKRDKSGWADIMQDIADYNSRIVKKDLLGIVPPITNASIKANVNRAFRPQKKEIIREQKRTGTEGK